MLPARYWSILAISPYEVAHIGPCLVNCCATWPLTLDGLHQLCILEGSNCGQCDSISEIITIKSNVIAFGIAFEVLKGRRNNFEHFW